jgi:hypothetical protein
MVSRSFGVITCAVGLIWPGAASHLPHDRLNAAPAALQPASCPPDDGQRVARCGLGTVAADPPAARRGPGAVLADSLEACSPFYDIEGAKELDFDATGAVTESIQPPDKPRGDGDQPPAEVVGRFEIAGPTGRVVVMIGNVRQEYSLVIPGEGSQCILAMGNAKTVDLQRSWFAAPSDDPGSDTGPPDYRRAAARRPPPAAGWRGL